jgi:hypothetical protein
MAKKTSKPAFTKAELDLMRKAVEVRLERVSDLSDDARKELEKSASEAVTNAWFKGARLDDLI